jgi:hypothetical protein
VSASVSPNLTHIKKATKRSLDEPAAIVGARAGVANSAQITCFPNLTERRMREGSRENA